MRNLLDIFRRAPVAAPPRRSVESAASGFQLEPNFSRTQYGLGNCAPFDGSGGVTPYYTAASATFKQCFKGALAGRITELWKDFIFGDGQEFKSENPKVQEWLDGYLENEDVAFLELLPMYCQDWLKLGEMPLKAVVDPNDGLVFWEPLDPTRITSVYQMFGKVRAFRYDRPYNGGWTDFGVGNGPENLTVVHRQKDPRAPGYNQLTGDVVYWTYQESVMLSRGYPPLHRVIDYLNALDELTFSELDRALSIRKFLIHWVKQNAQKADIDALKMAWAEAPKTGQVVFSDQTEEIKFLSPGLDASYSAEQIYKSIRNTVYAGAGLAEHWLAEGGDVNRATAKEMGPPIYRKLLNMQAREVKYAGLMISFARDKAIENGALPVNPADPKTAITVTPDPIDFEDLNAEADLLRKQIDSAALGITSGLMSSNEGRQMIERSLKEQGIKTEELGADTLDALAANQQAHERRARGK